jgi:ferredoxin
MIMMMKTIMTPVTTTSVMKLSMWTTSYDADENENMTTTATVTITINECFQERKERVTTRYKMLGMRCLHCGKVCNSKAMTQHLRVNPHSQTVTCVTACPQGLGMDFPAGQYPSLFFRPNAHKFVCHECGM